MLSAVATSTVAVSAVAPVLVTVKLSVLVPLSPSVICASLIAKLGAVSSLVIVPCPWLSVIVALVGLLTLTMNFSWNSASVSPMTSTVTG